MQGERCPTCGMTSPVFTTNPTQPPKDLGDEKGLEMSTQLSHALERIKLLEVGHEKLEAHIKEVRLSSYNSALEQAAKVCDYMMLRNTLKDCAAAIRAMKKL